MNTSMQVCITVVAVLAQMVVVPVFAQSPNGEAISNFENYEPVATAVRIPEKSAPKIDGDLSDAIWETATLITDFYQVEPEEGVAPSRSTEARILYDSQNLYISVKAFDDPDLITRTTLQRDPALNQEDGIRLLIDSLGTYRDSYFFAVNPNGARLEALTQNNNDFRSQWDSIWRARTKILDDGWAVEFAIPFRSIAFDGSLDAWNFQIIRTIRRNNEEIRWSNINRSRGRIDLSAPGKLVGIEEIDSGLGLEGNLFLSAVGSRDFELGENNTALNPSGNFFYKITPSLTGSLTFNTDFSDAPLDNRQVNTGRFSLFFPETRDFFLQDAAVFEFGGRTFRGNRNGLPLFTRRIGIVDGTPVDLIAGAKVSGKYGPFNVGVLTTRTAGNETFDGQTLTLGRISANVLSESRVGIIFTNGDPEGGASNTVGGADFQYRNTSLLGEGVTTADFAYIRSIDDGVHDDFLTASVAYEGDRWRGVLRAQEIGEHYNPRLGFVNRTGIRRYRGNFRRRWRPQSDLVRTIDAGAFTTIVTDIGDDVLDREYGVFANVQNAVGDGLEFEFQNSLLDIQEPFEIADRLPVAAAEYKFNQVEFSGGLARSRKFSAGAFVRVGNIYDGDFLASGSRLSWRPSGHFNISSRYSYTQFTLPTGKLGIHVTSIESTIAFTPEMRIQTDIQYDNISESLTGLARFSWQPLPTREIFFSFGHSSILEAEDFPTRFRAQAANIGLRLGYTFRL